MKTILFFASFLFFLFTTNALPLVDVDGNPLENGGGPYLLRAGLGPFGYNFKLGSAELDKTCPLDVILDQFVLDKRFTLSLNFTFETRVRIRFLDYSHPLLISSPVESPCNVSTIWRVDEDREGIITSGGSGYCFRIAQHPQPLRGPPYMLEYCPSLCGSDVQTCYPLYVKGEHLAIGDETTRPVEVGFIKVQQQLISL